VFAKANGLAFYLRRYSRRAAAGMAEPQRSFRRVKGHRDLPKLTAAIRRELEPTTPTAEAATLIAAWQPHRDRRRSSTANGTTSSDK
jgi:hypothetical protein